MSIPVRFVGDGTPFMDRVMRMRGLVSFYSFLSSHENCATDATRLVQIDRVSISSLNGIPLGSPSLLVGPLKFCLA